MAVDEAPPVRRPSPVATAALILYCGVLATIGLWPHHVDEGMGLGGHWWYTPLEITANVGLFVPLGILSVLAARRRRWTRTAAGALALSGAIELTQHLALTGRTGSWRDVAANTVGAALGAAAALAAGRRAS